MTNRRKRGFGVLAERAPAIAAERPSHRGCLAPFGGPGGLRAVARVGQHRWRVERPRQQDDPAAGLIRTLQLI
jgi:hypothetical protein